MDTDIAGFEGWEAPAAKKKKRNRFQTYSKAPKAKELKSPRYPDICKTAGVYGKVTIEFYIDESGKVDKSSVVVLNSVPCLDQVCIDAIKKSKWKPARQDKEFVGVYLTKTFNFSLENEN